jgi:hypothetical protein
MFSDFFLHGCLSDGHCLNIVLINDMKFQPVMLILPGILECCVCD